MDIQSLIKSMEKAENDNRKFALLLILSELMKSNKLNELKEATAESKALNERLFNSIGSHFLARLITTKQVTENCSPLIFKSLAFSILSQFLDYPHLISDPILVSKIDSICDILLIEPNCNDDIETNLILDAFKYLFALSKCCPDHLCQNSNLIEILMDKTILNENNSTKQDMNDDDLDSIACKLIISLCYSNTNIPEITDLKHTKIDKCFKSLLNAIKSNNELFKFRLINHLNKFLEDEQVAKEYLSNEQTGEIIFDVLNQLFKSKLNRKFKILTFKLLNNFVKLFQFEYIYLKNRSFFYLIIHLLCIDIGYSLEETKNGIDLSDMISIYYSLMEEIIIILSTASPFDDEDDSDDDKKEIEPEFKNVIKVIVETLETIILYVKDSLLDLTNLKPNELVLQIASIRLLNCWLAHETLLEDKLIELMPDLIKFADYYKTLNQSNKIDLFEFLRPGLQRCLIDLEDKKELLNRSKSTDFVKLEYERTELNDQINNINIMLQKCN